MFMTRIAARSHYGALRAIEVVGDGTDAVIVRTAYGRSIGELAAWHTVAFARLDPSNARLLAQRIIEAADLVDPGSRVIAALTRVIESAQALEESQS